MEAALVLLQPSRHLVERLAHIAQLCRTHRHQAAAGTEAKGVDRMDLSVGKLLQRLLATLEGKFVGAAHRGRHGEHQHIITQTRVLFERLGKHFGICRRGRIGVGILFQLVIKLLAVVVLPAEELRDVGVVGQVDKPRYRLDAELLLHVLADVAGGVHDDHKLFHNIYLPCAS